MADARTAARERIAAAAAARAGREPGDVEIVAATKYVALEDLGALADAGVTRVGENRAQDLQAKHAEYGDRFTWDFIGHVQSRKVPQILPLVQRIHSVGSDSVLGRLERHMDLARPGFEILVEVNVAREEGKSGIDPDELGAFLERCPIAPVGPDDDAAARRGTAGGGSPRCASWRRGTACASSRWAPRRTSRWRSRRARRSSVWAPSCSVQAPSRNFAQEG